jgi:hypothetical protein
VTDVLEDIELHILVGDMDQEMCQSTLHMVEWKMPEHPAHWYASAPCASVIAICDDRKRKCFRDGSWQCVSGCTAIHPFDHIEFVRI